MTDKHKAINEVTKFEPGDTVKIPLDVWPHRSTGEFINYDGDMAVVRLNGCYDLHFDPARLTLVIDEWS